MPYGLYDRISIMHHTTASTNSSCCTGTHTKAANALVEHTAVEYSPLHPAYIVMKGLSRESSSRSQNEVQIASKRRVVDFGRNRQSILSPHHASTRTRQPQD